MLLRSAASRKRAFRSGRLEIDSSSPQAKGLIGCWPLTVDYEEQKAFDICKGHELTVDSGVTLVRSDHPKYGPITAYDGSALSGTNAIGSSSDNTLVPNMPLPGSVSCWLKASSAGAVLTTHGGSNFAGYLLQIVAGKLDLVLGDNSGTSTTDYYLRRTDDTQWDDDIWFHCVATASVVNSTGLKIYRDGVELSTSGNGSFITYSSGDNKPMILNRGTGAYRCVGQVCDVRFYDYALTTAEITDLYLNPQDLFLPRPFTKPAYFFSPVQGSGQTVVVGIASETDTTLVVTPKKDIPVGLSSETDTALFVTPKRDITTGLATETDTALAVTHSKTVQVGIANETNTALTVSPVTANEVAVGLATETDTALGVTPSGATEAGLASETDTALALSSSKSKAVGLSSETDTAFSVTPSRTVAVGIATETDTAFATSHSKSVPVGIAAETDTALAVAASGAVNVGVAAETDSAFSVSVAKTQAVGIATETDAALAVTSGVMISAGIASETDSSFSVTILKTQAVGIASETENALAITIVGGTTGLGVGEETDTALTATPVKQVNVGIAAETDSAFAVAAGPFVEITGTVLVGTRLVADNVVVATRVVGDVLRK